MEKDSTDDLSKPQFQYFLRSNFYNSIKGSMTNKKEFFVMTFFNKLQQFFRFFKIVIEGLTDEEIEILYFFVKNRYINVTSPILLPALWSEYSGMYDVTDLTAKLSKLKDRHYINACFIQEGNSGYGIWDVSTYKKLSKIFKYRLYRDKIFQFLKRTWEFLWRHFIITILTALITAYLYNRFFS